MALKDIVFLRLQRWVGRNYELVVLPADKLDKLGLDATTLAGSFRIRVNAWFSDFAGEVAKTVFKPSTTFGELRDAILAKKKVADLAEYTKLTVERAHTALYGCIDGLPEVVLKDAGPDTKLGALIVPKQVESLVQCCNMKLDRYLLVTLTADLFPLSATLKKIEANIQGCMLA